MENKPILPNKLSKRQQIENGTYVPINDISNKEEKKTFQDEGFCGGTGIELTNESNNRIKKGENPRKGERIVYYDKFWDIKLDKDT